MNINRLFSNLFFSTLLFMICSSNVGSATFIPSPIDSQLKESDAVILGEYQGSSYKKLPSGEVVTEMVFSVSKGVGLAHNDVVSAKSFKVLHPGGVWQGIVYHVHGTPKFKKGEEVLLLVNKSKYGYVFTNLALGKYNVLKKGGVKYVSSSVFPDHPKLGQMLYSEFEDAVWGRFGGELADFADDRKVFEGRLAQSGTAKGERLGRPGRAPASIADESTAIQDSSQKNGIGIFWLIIILGSLGTAVAYAVKRK